MLRSAAGSEGRSKAFGDSRLVELQVNAPLNEGQALQGGHSGRGRPYPARDRCAANV